MLIKRVNRVRIQSSAQKWAGFKEQFQEWPISFGASGYVALYRLQQDVALVVAVKHQKEIGYLAS